MKSTTRPSRRNGKQATTASTPSTSGPRSPPASGRFTVPDEVDALALAPQQRGERLEEVGRVVVARDHHDGASGAEAQQRLDPEA